MERHLTRCLNWMSFRHLLPFLLYHIPILHFQGHNTADSLFVRTWSLYFQLDMLRFHGTERTREVFLLLDERAQQAKI